METEQRLIKKHSDVIVLATIITLFAVMFIALAINRHQAFQTNGFDLGNVNQAIWNTAQGRPLAFTNMAPIQNRLALHVEPILFLFVPFYWLGLGGPKLLISIQSLVVCFGAWPLYLIAKPKIGKWPGLAVCLAYLLYPALEAAMMFDFHAVTLAPTFLLAAFYWLEQSSALTASSRPPSQILTGSRRLFSSSARNKISKSEDYPASAAMSPEKSSPRFAMNRFFLFAILAIACKEDMGLVVGMLGLYTALVHRRWLFGLTLFVVCVSWSAFAVLGIQNLFGGNVQAGRYEWLNAAIWQPQQVWMHLWHEVEVRNYLMGVLMPVAGLALLSPLTLLPTLPSLAINLLSNQGFQWRLEEFHYAAPIAPFIFIATIKGFQRLLRFTSPDFSRHIGPIILGLVLLSASLSYHYFRGFTPLARPFQWRTITDHHRLGADMAARIPSELSLLAPLNLNPHVSSRQHLHQTFDSRSDKDWLWLDVASLPNENGVQQFIRDQLLPAYTVVEAKDGYLILKPGPFTGNIAADFHTYAQPVNPVNPMYPVSVYFTEALELIGYDLTFNREEEVQVRTYWRTHAALPSEVRPTLYLLDEQNNYLGATDDDHLPATLVWFPPQLWPIGQTMIVEFNSLNWHTRNRHAYRLALGVTTSADPWDVSRRWQPDIIESLSAPYISPDKTILELARIEQVGGMPEGGPTARQWQQPAVRQDSDAVFGGKIRLIGYDTPTRHTEQSTDTITVRLLWQAVDTSRDVVVRFVHVVNREGPPKLWGQQDSAPVAGTYPTRLWAKGEYVAETVIIPLIAEARAANQPYILHIGFYDPDSGQRVLTASGEDHIEIVVP